MLLYLCFFSTKCPLFYSYDYHILHLSYLFIFHLPNHRGYNARQLSVEDSWRKSVKNQIPALPPTSLVKLTILCRDSFICKIH